MNAICKMVVVNDSTEAVIGTAETHQDPEDALWILVIVTEVGQPPRTATLEFQGVAGVNPGVLFVSSDDLEISVDRDVNTDDRGGSDPLHRDCHERRQTSG